MGIFAKTPAPEILEISGRPQRTRYPSQPAYASQIKGSKTPNDDEDEVSDIQRQLKKLGEARIQAENNRSTIKADHASHSASQLKSPSIAGISDNSMPPATFPTKKRGKATSIDSASTFE